MKIVVASSNTGKVKEIQKVAEAYSNIEVVNPLELSKTLGKPPAVPESASGYLENAKLKAEKYWAWSGMPSLGDDSGLEVAALEGAPGIISARWAGKDATDEDNIVLLLKKLEGKENREALFRCTLYLAISEMEGVAVDAILRGKIALAPQGRGGFGYDPIFIPLGSNQTLAEIKESGISFKTHRVLALEKLFTKIAKAQ